MNTKNIMIIEDYLLTRTILRKMINSAELNVCADFDNAEEGILYLNSNKVDLVLMDIGLPFMNGVEASIIIKRLNPNVKIILMTSNVCEAENIASIFACVEGYILKDTDKNELSNIINTVLSGACWVDSRIQYLIFEFVKNLPKKDYLYLKHILNKEECTLINLILKGFEKHEAANYLNINLSDLHVCVRSIFKKISKTKKASDIIRSFQYDFIYN